MVRDALRSHVLAIPGTCDTIDEFWVPRSYERADLAVIGRSMDGFEIKTERDTLRRLPRQAEAYGRLFDQCSVVVAERHLDRAATMLPRWWGIRVVHVNGALAFTEVRKPRPNPRVEPDTLVRLLWKKEAIAALASLGATPPEGASRGALWRQLLGVASIEQLRAMVRGVLLSRDPADARIATRRFTVAASPRQASR